MSTKQPSLPLPSFSPSLPPQNATLKLVRQIEFEKAISIGDTETSTAECRRKIADGACPMPLPNTTYSGPLPNPPTADEGEGGRWKLTKEFVESMIQWFKEEKPLPKRLVWEIVLQCTFGIRFLFLPPVSTLRLWTL
jgi:serine/threonine-protein phosphatase 5